MKTRFGLACLNKGHMRIYSKKEGNCGKYLHRLIFEDFYNITLPDNIHIHHNDGNPLNNEIWNLIPMTLEEHISIHHKDMQFVKAMNDTGYYRVSIQPCSTCKQGFRWRYAYYENNKERAISSVSLDKLKEKVQSKGLDWIELNGAYHITVI